MKAEIVSWEAHESIMDFVTGGGEMRQGILVSELGFAGPFLISQQTFGMMVLELKSTDHLNVRRQCHLSSGFLAAVSTFLAARQKVDSYKKEFAHVLTL